MSQLIETFKIAKYCLLCFKKKMCGRAKWPLLILNKQLSWFSNFVVVLVLVLVLTDQTTETTLPVSSNLQMIKICKKIIYRSGNLICFIGL